MVMLCDLQAGRGQETSTESHTRQMFTFMRGRARVEATTQHMTEQCGSGIVILEGGGGGGGFPYRAQQMIRQMPNSHIQDDSPLRLQTHCR